MSIGCKFGRDGADFDLDRSQNGASAFRLFHEEAEVKEMGGRAQFASRVAAIAACVVGVLVLIGWAADVVALTRIIPDHAASQPLTAVGLILGSLALLALTLPGRWRFGATASTALLLLLALSEIFEHITGVDLNIGDLLFPRSVALQSDAYVHPGRMSVPTAVAFLLLAISFCLARVKGRIAGVLYSATSTTVLVLVGTALLAHLLVAEQFTGPFAFTLVAMPTAIGLGALAIGTLTLRTDAGWVGLLWNESVGASVARWLLPVMIAVPILVSWLANEGTNAGIYSPNLRLALVTSLTIVLLSTFVIWGAKQLDRLAAVQRTAAALRESEARTKAAEARQRTLAHELNHRVKNIMMLVQALARQSFRGTDLPKTALSAFEGRLAALSDAHDLLVGKQWDEAPMTEVAARVLEGACGAGATASCATGQMCSFRQPRPCRYR